MQTEFQLPHSLFPCRLTLAAQVRGLMTPLALEVAGPRLRATGDQITADLLLDPEEGSLRYTLTFQAGFPTRLQLALSLPDARQVFHLIPCCIHGDNNLPAAQPGHFPNLTEAYPDNVSCSPYWEFRADRAAIPLSMIAFQGGILALSVNPYTPLSQKFTTSREGFVRNGLFARAAHDGLPPACGVTAGYRNVPRSFINKDIWGPSTEHLAVKGTIEGRIFIRAAEDRRAAHALVREVYEALRIPPPAPLTPRQAAAALTESLLDVCWKPELGQFTNQHCKDPEKRELKPWRTLAEIGWTGGGVLSTPLLLAGRLLGSDRPIAHGRGILDSLSRAYNPASGLLWDVAGGPGGRHGLNGWWAGYLVRDVHCAYTNGSGLYHLLRGALLLRGAPEFNPAWLETGLQALDTVVRLQRPDGNFGYTYSAERPEILDPDGFAGAWFIPALALAWKHTGRAAYLDAARRGAAFYHTFVRDLACCGTPMDTWKSPDQEGNLGFIRGVRLLHAFTDEPVFLEMLRDAAHYEYLWRYGYRARPEFRPLAGSPWNSCGGSVTSVSNPHIHPMGLVVAADLRYLADRTGDPYHANRLEDSLHWALQTVALYPAWTGYGRLGVMTERFCPSDGLTIETLPDGTPSSIGFTYNGWAAAALLEGLAESMLP